MRKARVQEVFLSIQGEGIYAGRREVFVRFLGCNMKCIFCDVEREREAPYYIPLSLLQRIKEEGKGTKWLSLTGGEPLLRKDFLEEFLPLIKKEGWRINLETNATLPDKFLKIAGMVDTVSLDFKLPSSTLQRPYWKEHREFLSLARDKCFVKAVITNKTSEEEVRKAVKIVAETDRNIPLVLQPATPHGKFRGKPEMEKMLRFQEVALEELEDVRIIPQIHKFLGLR